MNRLYKNSLKTTPYQVYFNKIPSLNHMKQFDVPVFVHVNKIRRENKFSDRATENYFVGLTSSTVIYRIWEKRTNMVKFVKRVRFVEWWNRFTNTNFYW